jgi:hypothetical protein
MVIDAVTSADVFRAYFEHVLGATLSPGDIVVSAHKDESALELIRLAPSHRLGFNPIKKIDAVAARHESPRSSQP